MVARVFGIVDGTEVVLEQGEGDVWLVPVPFDVDGEYVVEIIAEDDAGNRSYLAKMLYVVNTALLCAHIVTLPYYGVLLGRRLKADVLSSRLAAAVLADKYTATLCPVKYYTEIIEPVCNLAGRRT